MIAWRSALVIRIPSLSSKIRARLATSDIHARSDPELGVCLSPLKFANKRSADLVSSDLILVPAS